VPKDSPGFAAAAGMDVEYDYEVLIEVACSPGRALMKCLRKPHLPDFSGSAHCQGEEFLMAGDMDVNDSSCCLLTPQSVGSKPARYYCEPKTYMSIYSCDS
jgi:uncharacterized protein (UPF0264 family)